MAAVAKKAGLAKGTLYLYFKTKEEIFLSLLESQFQQWLLDIGLGLQQDSLENLVRRICNYVSQRPKFMRLACAVNSILEQNLAYDVAAGFKKRQVGRLNETGALIEARFPEIQAGRGARLLLESYAMLLGAWQLAEPPRLIKTVIEQERLDLLRLDFAAFSQTALIRLWAEPIAAGDIRSS